MRRIPPNDPKDQHPDQTPLSKILNDHFKGKNLSLISRELGISKSLLSDWVSARRIPSLKNIEQVAKISDYIGMPLDQLLLGRSTHGEVVGSVQIKDGDRTYKVIVSRHE